MGGRVVLVRHAKSDYPWGVDDHDRPLSERGRRDAPLIGTWLDDNLSWEPGRPPAVRVSTARRAQLTWALASSRLSARWAEADEQDDGRIYEASVAALRDVAMEASGRSDSVVLVGHNPGMLDFVATFAAHDDLRDVATAKFPTSSVAVLEAAQPLADALRVPGSFRVSGFAVPRG